MKPFLAFLICALLGACPTLFAHSASGSTASDPADKALSSGNPRRAITLYRALMKKNSKAAKDPRIWFNYGIAYHSLKVPELSKSPNAELCFQTAARLTQDNPSKKEFHTLATLFVIREQLSQSSLLKYPKSEEKIHLAYKNFERIPQGGKKISNATAALKTKLLENLQGQILKLGFEERARDNHERAYSNFRWAYSIGANTYFTQNAAQMLALYDEIERDSSLSSTAFSASRIELTGVFSLGYDSNVYLSGNSEEKTSKAFLEAGGDIWLPLREIPKFEISSLTLLTWKEYISLAEMRSIKMEQIFPFQWQSPKHLYTLAPLGKFEFLGTSLLQTAMGAKGQVQWVEAKFKPSAFLSHKRHFPSKSSVAYLRGHSTALGGVIHVDPLPADLSCQYESQSLGVRSVQTTTHSGAPLSGTLPQSQFLIGCTAGGKWIDGKLTYMPSLGLTYHHFQGLAVPDQVEQRDFEWPLGMRVERGLFFIDLRWTLNASNLGENSLEDQNYHQWVAALGVTYPKR